MVIRSPHASDMECLNKPKLQYLNRWCIWWQGISPHIFLGVGQLTKSTHNASVSFIKNGKSNMQRKHLLVMYMWYCFVCCSLLWRVPLKEKEAPRFINYNNWSCWNWHWNWVTYTYIYVSGSQRLGDKKKLLIFLFIIMSLCSETDMHKLTGFCQK